jgi:hypothetical protein
MSASNASLPEKYFTADIPPARIYGINILKDGKCPDLKKQPAIAGMKGGAG